jgi:hypothetical protein
MNIDMVKVLLKKDGLGELRAASLTTGLARFRQCDAARRAGRIPATAAAHRAFPGSTPGNPPAWQSSGGSR